MKGFIFFSLLSLTLSTSALAAISPAPLTVGTTEIAIKNSISSNELDTQLVTNLDREKFLKKELSKKVRLLNQLQHGASAPVYMWEEEPVTQRNRVAIEKLLKLAVRRHLDELNRIQQINAEITSQLDWMSHNVTANAAPNPELMLSESEVEANLSSSLDSFHCGDVPVGFGSMSEKPLMQDFGTRKDSLTGLEWNSLGWWIGQKPASAIRACLKGKIVFSGAMQGRGHVIMIDHGADFLTIYANIAPSSSMLKLGTIVRTGQAIGNSLDSVYFEVRHKGKAVNPRLVFARQNLDILGL